MELEKQKEPVKIYSAAEAFEKQSAIRQKAALTSKRIFL